MCTRPAARDTRLQVLALPQRRAFKPKQPCQLHSEPLPVVPIATLALWAFPSVPALLRAALRGISPPAARCAVQFQTRKQSPGFRRDSPCSSTGRPCGPRTLAWWPGSVTTGRVSGVGSAFPPVVAGSGSPWPPQDSALRPVCWGSRRPTPSSPCTSPGPPPQGRLPGMPRGASLRWPRWGPWRAAPQENARRTGLLPNLP